MVLVVFAIGGAADTGAASLRRDADQPVLVPWRQVGKIRLGERSVAVYRDYGAANFHVLQRWGDNTQGYFRLHGSRVVVTFYGRHVGEISFTSPHYRTRSGFGVGSRIPLGPCYRTAPKSCEHRWQGFVYDEWNKGTPCQCWLKVGTGRRSLPVTQKNFGKPWFFIYTKHGRATRFYFALKFID